ncbi:MAG: excinuclease ABC subunit UvrB, partial [Candidatus Latescibacteria bacterium]|nr:excinuclease ABC subunit UvrB [Candidatus Latescibacterota bacterium]
RGEKHQCLLGITGSGKTFTMAHVIQNVQRPTLVISPNKTLAAQLYGEFKSFFPDNRVEYFISYYDYYQPEAYLPTTDTYIEKDSSVNDDIDKLRLRATTALLERRDVIIVASVSSIYSLGSPDEWKEFVLSVERGQSYEREELLHKLIDMHYTRNDYDFARGTFRVRGDSLDIVPADQELAIRIEMFGDEIDRISEFDPLTGEVLNDLENVAVYPARHFVTTAPRLEKAIKAIEAELDETHKKMISEDKLLEAQRIDQRTRFDLEMMKEIGFCAGIENYSRHLSGRNEGDRPFCLFDFFPSDYLIVIDESHVAVPQIRAMYNGDRSRKMTLVDHGFRLPSALDNRPLTFEEYESMVNQVVYVSATPADYELEQSKGVYVEQVIRPTGLMDPMITVMPVENQIDDLVSRCRERAERGERVLVTTLTKRMSEDLTDYLRGLDIRVRYLHSTIDSIERVEILRELRMGQFDVLVGINLLREGLDLPEVSLVAILDADKEGFLRSERSLIQTSGRAARNVNGEVIFYADRITDSMKKAMDETTRRRALQAEYNEVNGIVPTTIYKSIDEIMLTTSVADARTVEEEMPILNTLAKMDRGALLEELRSAMHEAAANLEFEKAAKLRDEIGRLEAQPKD